jgi:rhomboid protease GluP
LQANSKQFMPTYVLIAANVGAYALTSMMSGNFLTTSDSVLNAYGQYNAAVFNGEVWRLFTAMFMHVDITHIAGNMLFLFIFGLRAEEMFDLEEYLAVYFLSGLTGGLLSLLMGPEVLSVGASGAIFGILGATLIYVRRAIGQSIATALFYAFFLFIINIGENVNILAHLGGLAVGLLIGYLVGTAHRSKPRVAYRYGYSYGPVA